jgi:hypothetical protein
MAFKIGLTICLWQIKKISKFISPAQNSIRSKTQKKYSFLQQQIYRREDDLKIGFQLKKCKD